MSYGTVLEKRKKYVQLSACRPLSPLLWKMLAIFCKAGMRLGNWDTAVNKAKQVLFVD